jgi:hypothetical protein
MATLKHILAAMLAFLNIAYVGLWIRAFSLFETHTARQQYFVAHLPLPDSVILWSLMLLNVVALIYVNTSSLRSAWFRGMMSCICAAFILLMIWGML